VFESYDYGVLMGIPVTTRGPVDYQGLRELLDLLDHAVYSDAEIRAAIGRLADAGFVAISPWGHRAEDVGEIVVRTALVPATADLRLDQEKKVIQRLLASVG
jgi:hypothetical protein